MKKLLSILLSAALCASIVLVNPEWIDVPAGDEDNDTSIEMEYGEEAPEGDEVAPCDDSFPPYGEDA